MRLATSSILTSLYPCHTLLSSVSLLTVKRIFTIHPRSLSTGLSDSLSYFRYTCISFSSAREICHNVANIDRHDRTMPSRILLNQNRCAILISEDIHDLIHNDRRQPKAARQASVSSALPSVRDIFLLLPESSPPYLSSAGTSHSKSFLDTPASLRTAADLQIFPTRKSDGLRHDDHPLSNLKGKRLAVKCNCPACRLFSLEGI